MKALKHSGALKKFLTPWLEFNKPLQVECSNCVKSFATVQSERKSENVEKSLSYPKKDKEFFSTIRNKTNPYWIQNPDDLIARMDLSRFFESSFMRLAVQENLRKRKSPFSFEKLEQLWKLYKDEMDSGKRMEIAAQLASVAIHMPNLSHKHSLEIDGEEPKVIGTYGEPKDTNGVVEFKKLCEKSGLLRSDNLGNLSHHRSYYLKGPLAELEEALVKFALTSVPSHEYTLITVPDMVYSHIIEASGVTTRGVRDMVFWLDHPCYEGEDLCLSGTSEMALGGFLKDRVFKEEELPFKLIALSRCFRAETSSVEEERGIYRVHEFTKVEMYGVTANESGSESDKLHSNFRIIQEDNFKKLELHFKTLEMPPTELGLSAYRKFDIEAWMPGRKMYGEISSCSNCTDFQSRRLNIRYVPKGKSLSDAKFVHTVNGTLCAVPRTLISIVENFQDGSGKFKVPKVLEKYFTRPWDQILKQNMQFNSIFMRIKSQQINYTKKYRSACDS